jgi:succinate dehydrogenase hydrophobic anchor subunit
MWRSTFLWLLQRITAAILVVLLGLHLWASNFTTNWTSMFRGLVDLSLLALALLHGLNGVRTVALDFGVGSAGKRFLSASLALIGFVAFLFGAYGLWPLIFGT